jgi:HEAT repeat protein
MEYQYFTTARTVFKNEDALTSFYGLMVILLFAGAFLLQLVSGKLMNKLGASNMLIAISAVFALSFVLVTTFIQSPLALAAVAIGYSFTYLLLYYFAEPSYQLFFKMLPLQKRDGFRFTAQSIAASTGILLGSGLSMLHSAGGVSLFVQAIVGVVLAVILTAMAWGVRTLYVRMLIGSLESGAAHVKDALQELLGTLTSGRLGKALTEQLRHPDESVREIAIELLQKSPDLTRTEELLRCCEDSSPRIRVAALQAVHPAGWLSLAAERRQQLLADPDANARAVVYRGLFMADIPADERQRWIDMACGDENPEIRAMALMAMSEAETAAGAERMDTDVRRLLEEGGESAVAACGVIGDKKLNDYFMNVLMLFGDPRPYVKFAAVRAIGKLGGEETAKELLELMVGAETELRSAIRDALTELGAAAIPALHRALSTPNWSVWETAALVLGAIGTDSDIRHQLVPSCVERLAELQEVHRYSALIEGRGDKEWLALAAGRTNEIRQVVLDAVWKVMVRFSDERAVPHIRLAIEGEEEEVRDNGMEVLAEGLGDARLSAALLAYYRYDPSIRQDNAEAPKVTDGWLQAIAIKSGAVEGDEFLMSRWEYLSALDKMVFLKQVPLFERISVEELSRVATIAQEKIYEDGDYLVKQGETGIALVAIVEGHVELSGQDSMGNIGTIGVLGPKQSFGESALFDDRPSLISAQALFDQVRTLRIKSGELSHLVRLYPDIGVGLLRASGDRIRTLEQLILKLG